MADGLQTTTDEMAGAAPAKTRVALMVDLERCFGCRSCEAACKMENGLGFSHYRGHVVWLTPTKAKAPLNFVNVLCQQCERPACLRACASKPRAIFRHSDGTVAVIIDRCTGCQECVKACPYGAVGFDAQTQKALKCDLCADRRARGLQPACVATCPSFALTFGTTAELKAKAAAEGRTRRDLDDFGQRPTTIYLEPLARNWHAEGSFSPLGTPAEPIERMEAIASRGQRSTTSQLNPFDSSATDIHTPYVRRLDVPADRVVVGGCNICFNSCSVRYHLLDGQIVAITGNPDDPMTLGRLCAKGQMIMQMYHSERRLRYPMRRVGNRGEGKFERTTWDQALDGIAERLRAIREQHGSDSLGLFTGTRSGALNNSAYALMFGDMFGTLNREGTGPLCNTGGALAGKMTQGERGGANIYTEDDIGSSRFYLLVGDNMGETRPVYFGMLNDWRIKHKIPMVVVDPRQSATASKADQWLPIRPGTDMALGLAMLHHIFTYDLVCHQFVDGWVLGYEEIRQFVLGRGYSPEWAEPITGIAASTIHALSDAFAKAERAIVFMGRGVNQHSNSVQTNRVFRMMAALCGHYGKKGAGAMVFATGTQGGQVRAPKQRRAAMKPAIRKSPTGWLDAMISGKPYPIKALLMTCNPASLWPEQAKVREALQKLDLVVHMELFPNQSSQYADYILPMAAGIECGDINRGNDERRLVWIPKLIDPPGEAKPDAYFWVELGKRFGFDDVLKEEYKDPAVLWDLKIEQSADTCGRSVAALQSSPTGFLREGKARALFLEGDPDTNDPERPRFPTPSGKLELWTPELERQFQAIGLSALPEFYTEREQLVDLPHLEYECGDDEIGVLSPFWNDACYTSPVRIADGPGWDRRGFDMELVTGRASAAHFHSWMQWLWQAEEMWPNQYAQIHPDRACRLGIRDGDRVVVETRYGRIEAVAWLYIGIRESTVFVPIGWDEKQPFHSWKPVNWLTGASERCPISDQTNLKVTLCRVKKA